MDPFQAIDPPGSRPDGFGPGEFGPGSGSGNPDTPQTANPPQQTITSVAQESQAPQSQSTTTMSMDSAPTNNPNQPPAGDSSSIDVANVPASASVLSVGGASLGSSSTTVDFQSSSAVATLSNSATPLSTLFNSAVGGSGPSTTTVTGPSNASASAARATDGKEGITSATPAVLKNQTIVGVAVGIGIWLLVIIAALSFCLWRKRKIIRERGGRLEDDDASLVRPNMAQRDVEAIMGMAPTRPAAQSRSSAPTLPPPAFLRRSTISTMDSVTDPLGSHPVSRDSRSSSNDREEMPALSLFEYENLGRLSALPRSLSVPPRSPLTLFPGAQRMSHYSDVTPIPSQTPPKDRSLVTMGARSSASDLETSTTPEPIAALPPSLGKLNSWLEENRRRSRMAAASSGVRADTAHRNANTTRIEKPLGEEEEVGKMRADSGTLGTPIMSSRAGPVVSRPMSLASLKEVYRRSATLERSLIESSSVSERSATPSK